MNLKMFLLMIMQVFPLKVAESEISKTEKYKNLVTLKNEFAEVGILTNAGGRIVIYKDNEGENILKSDTNNWNIIHSKPLEQHRNMSIIPFNGHITWLGPQSKWWLEQEVDEKLKLQKSLWPPDPFLIYSQCEVLEQKDNCLIIRNPDSPITGVSLTKTFNLQKNGELEIISKIENITERTIEWDIWFNTRLEGRSRFFVPIKENTDVRVEHSANNICEINENFIDGYFTFDLCDAEELNEITAAKAFIQPSENKLYAFKGENLFIIEFELFNREELHPNQALVEVFNRITPNNDDLLELEHHGPYTKLKSGENTSLREIWTLKKYYGAHSIQSQLEFINNLK